MAQQQQQQQHKGGSRWTHFGARLRPLQTGLSPGIGQQDHREAASNSKSLVLSPRQMQQTRASSNRPELSSNQLDSTSADEGEDPDDDQDSEALLYKMMQQQSFLMSPTWQDPNEQQQQLQQPREAALDSGAANVNGQQSQLPASNSKRVIKLLKSYSHIHQVDDSDDQIRGTRIPVSRVSNQNQLRAVRGRQHQHDQQHNNALR